MPRNPVSKGKHPLGIGQMTKNHPKKDPIDEPSTTNSVVIPEKDRAELELERLVFGDEPEYTQELQNFRQDYDGLSTDSEAHSENEHEVATDLGTLHDDDLFFMDTGELLPASDSVALTPQADHHGFLDEVDPPAWVDSDDERLSVSLATNTRLRKLRINEEEDVINGREYTRRLQQQFERLYPTPEWADPQKVQAHRKKRRRTSESGSSSGEEDSDAMSIDLDDLSTSPLAELLRSTNSFTEAVVSSDGTRRKLRPEVIDIQRTKDVGGAQPSAILSLSFHPSAPVLLSSGPSSLCTLHHISPTAPSPNPILTTLSIPHHPITTSTIHPLGERIFLSSRRRYFHVWSLETGKVSRVSRIYGHASEQKTCERFKLSPCGQWIGLVGSGRKGGGVINILDAHTGQWICQARVEGRGGVADFVWWRDGRGLVVLGKGGEAIEYSIQERKVVARWVDDGSIGTTVVTMGGVVPNLKGPHLLGGDRWIAVGSQSGIVNVYDRSSWAARSAIAVPERPKPQRAFDQLTTPTSHLVFSPDGQLLVMASRWKKDAMRLVHLPSCTVYKNWPASGTPLGRISAVAISSNGGLLAVGNEAGKIRLWEFRA